MSVFVLIHSPFVGALTWRPAALALEEKGHVAVIPTLSEVRPPYWPHYASLVADAIQGLRSDEPLALVAHSAAGLLIPAARAAMPDKAIRGYIFVDAVVPRKGANLVELIPANVGIGIEQLRAQATDGLLPPWGTGWPEDLWRQLIPDDALRERFIEDLRPMPLALYEERVPLAAGWPDAPCSYLRFSVLYADAEREAHQSGWTTREASGGHLHMLVEPTRVADSLIELAA
jgi:alpha/beta hydrolase family protein